MLELLAAYTIEEIIVFIVMLALALKGAVSFYDWANDRLRKKFGKETVEDQKSAILQGRLLLGEQKMKEHDEKCKMLEDKINNLTDMVNLLINSDRDSTKSHLVDRHHYFCYTKKYIDDYSLDCLEKRFKHYKEEGGNSYIEDLMEELRALPKQPPRR